MVNWRSNNAHGSNVMVGPKIRHHGDDEKPLLTFAENFRSYDQSLRKNAAIF
jgi:hypothetical protein